MRKYLLTLLCLLFFNPAASFADPEYIALSSLVSQSEKIPFSEMADAIVQDLKSANETKEIITFFGFSSASYEDPEEVDLYIEQILEKECSIPEKCSILLGSTDGIFRVAEIAEKKGIAVNAITTDQGVHHFKSLSEEARRSVKRFYTVPVEAYGWMDSAEGKKVISPVTDALVRASDKIYMVGGGAIAIMELQYALQQQKPVIYYPAKFDQKKFKDLAKSLESTNPIQTPTSPYGFLFEYLMEVDPIQVTGLTLSYPEQWKEEPAYLALWEHLEGHIDLAERTLDRLLQHWNSLDLPLPVLESDGWEIIGSLYSTDFYPTATSNNANNRAIAG